MLVVFDGFYELFTGWISCWFVYLWLTSCVRFVVGFVFGDYVLSVGVLLCCCRWCVLAWVCLGLTDLVLFGILAVVC